MSKTKVNIIDPKTGEFRVGCLDNESKRVKFSDNREYSESYLKKQGDIGYFETYKEGTLLQKVGKFLGF